MKRNAFPRQRHGRRGTVAVLVAVSMFFILGSGSSRSRQSACLTRVWFTGGTTSFCDVYSPSAGSVTSERSLRGNEAGVEE